MSITIKLRRGNATDWTSQNIVLASGEPGYEIDTGRLKIGDGSTSWTNLSYSCIIPSGFVAGDGIALDLTNNSGTLTISTENVPASSILGLEEAIDDRIGTGLFVAGTGIDLLYEDSINSFTVSVTGLINNPADNRILTSRDSTTTGIDAESNLTFDGSLLGVSGDLIAGTGNFHIVQFNTDNGQVDTQGQIGWNDTDGTVDVALTDTAIVHIGEHTLYRIRNNTGDVLYKGQAVSATGIHPNGLINPDLYVADGSVREIRFMGLVFEDVNNNNNGYVINFGHIYNIDTRGNVATDYAVGDETWLDGDILYVHPTVAGKLTKNEPKHSIAVAIILDAANNGKIFVRPTSYGHLDDNHDVNVSGVSDGQYLQYNAATDYWIPTSSGTFSVVNVDNLRLDGNTLSATNTNGNIIVQTSGTGALQRDSGGNSRGQYAVDLQNARSLNTQVTSGNYSVIGGGRNNTASSVNTVVGGGYANQATNTYSVVAGGSTNTSSGYYSTVSGGLYNTANGGRSVVGGGYNNTASAYSSTVGGGESNNSGSNGATIAGGKSNTASGYYTSIGGGLSNSISSGSYSVIGGGRSNANTGNYSTVSGGYHAKASRWGEVSHAAGRFASAGDAQHTVLVARRTTADATANQVLFLNGSSQRLTIPTATMWTFEVKLSAYNDTDHEGAWWIIRGGIINNDGGDVALVGSPITENGADTSLSTASASVVADDTNDALEIRVTGVAGKDIRWVAVVDISQVSYGTP